MNKQLCLICLDIDIWKFICDKYDLPRVIKFSRVCNNLINKINVCLLVCLIVCLFNSLPACLPACLPARSSVRPSVCRSVRSSVCLSDTLIDSLFVSMFDWLIDWLIDWLSEWFRTKSFRSFVCNGYLPGGTVSRVYGLYRATKPFN